jgi:signal transduction histidine kinase
MTFHYSSDSLFAPERVRFRYRLQGAEASWSDSAAGRQVLYNNLGPGDYQFHVIASRDGGLWNSPETVYSFTIDPAYWQTWWFRIATVLAIILSVLLIMRLRTVRLAHQLTMQFQERLSERTRIAQELHDTLLQSFQGLMLRFQTVENLLPSRPAEAKDILGQALERADDALTESRAAIQNIRSGSAQNPNLAQAITSMMAEMAEECAARGNHRPEYSVFVEGAPKPLRPWISSEVRRIANESVRNSFQHAQATQIEADVTFSESNFRIRFRDNGVGIDPAVLLNGARSGHWGLIGMKERARHIGAKLDVWSKPGAGTELDLRVPGRLAYDESGAPTGLRLFRRRSKRDYEQQP